MAKCGAAVWEGRVQKMDPDFYCSLPRLHAGGHSRGRYPWRCRLFGHKYRGWSCARRKCSWATKTRRVA